MKTKKMGKRNLLLDAIFTFPKRDQAKNTIESARSRAIKKIIGFMDRFIFFFQIFLQVFPNYKKQLFFEGANHNFFGRLVNPKGQSGLGQKNHPKLSFAV